MLVRDALLPFVVQTSSAKGGHQRQLLWLLRFLALTNPFSVSLSLWPIIIYALVYTYPVAISQL